MYIIEANDSRRKWISGVFRNLNKFEKYLSLIPDELKSYQHTKQITIAEYPFYIIENKEGFTYLNKYEFIQMLNNASRNSGNDNVVYFNFYFIEADYQTSKPGSDYMGIIKHEHVTNDFLTFYKKQGIEFLIRNGFCK
ncbi:hypothetical protein [Paenibacillus sp. SC116]|uniref:hypothetical protein n=1 Tax=Paenibacillus sp. SC116 TaxID=2968986 RepID=UPI00215B5FCD|nr:hypothetical protein [Paenibacillus sp. SC116]